MLQNSTDYKSYNLLTTNIFISYKEKGGECGRQNKYTDFFYLDLSVNIPVKTENKRQVQVKGTNNQLEQFCGGKRQQG